MPYGLDQLGFFGDVVICEGDPVPRNQNMALRAISDKNLDNIWFVQPSDDAGAPRTYGAMARFKF